jgi:hypothetical protein
MSCNCNDNKPIYNNTSPVLYIEARDPSTEALFAPASISVLITKPDASTQTIFYPGAAWSNPSVGLYELVYPVTQIGWHTARVTITRTSGASGADEAEFEVLA